MMTIKPLTDTGFDILYKAWNNAFAGYARSWTEQELSNDLERRGYQPSLSFGAFNGDELVSFTLNGIGYFNGVKTAYDTGTGTIEAYRGQGLAPRIFNELVPVLKNEGVEQYLLEVLQVNETAINIYKNVGFDIVRGLNYFVQPMLEVNRVHKSLPENIVVKETGFEDIGSMQRIWDFKPSWQNQFDSLLRVKDRFKVLGAYDGNALIGYGIIEAASGDIPQLAVDESYRRQGVGTVILNELLNHNRHSVVKLINAEESYEPMVGFLQYHGITKAGAQFEMTRKI